MMELECQPCPRLLLEKSRQDFTVVCYIVVGKEAQMQEYADQSHAALGGRESISNV